jgi:hypothetical protein
MPVKTAVKAGALVPNHNETLGGLRVKTALKAGDPAVPLALTVNHNETSAIGIRVKTAVKAGALVPNHNETLTGGSSITEDLNAGSEIEDTELASIAAALRVRTGLLAGVAGHSLPPCI